MARLQEPFPDRFPAPAADFLRQILVLEQADHGLDSHIQIGRLNQDAAEPVFAH